MGNTGTFVGFRTDTNDPRRGDDGLLWAQVVGGAQDAELALLRVALLCRFPQTIPADGLDALGNGAFLLERYPNEDDDTYRARLTNWRQIYSEGGSPQGVIDELGFYGLPQVRVLEEAYYAPIYDGAWYSRSVVIVGPDFGATDIGPSLLGVNTVLGEVLLGSTCTFDQRTAMKRISWRWKAVHGVIPEILLVYTAGLLGVDTVLGSCTLGDVPAQQCYLTIQPQFGEETYLSTYPLGEVDLG